MLPTKVSKNDHALPPKRKFVRENVKGKTFFPNEKLNKKLKKR